MTRQPPTGTGHEYAVVDEVTRETAEMLRGTDAILAWRQDAETVLVLEPKGGET